MKINDIKYLINIYGKDATLADVLKKVQGNKIHMCPKCGGSGRVSVRRNVAQYWECCDRYETYTRACDLCHGEGYTEHEYKPKMVQDGWE
jgi:DnaJ-class molecular chaperone